MFSYFTRHRTAANLLLMLMLAAGLLSIPNMRAQFFPDVVVDQVIVNTVWDGAGAADVDRAINQVLEPQLRAVDGVSDTDSAAQEGRSQIRLEFRPNYDMERARQDVEEALNTASDLPSDAEDPVIREGNWADDVVDVVLTGPVSVGQLGRFADELVARFFEAGVTEATVRGFAAREIVVEVSTRDLIRYDVSMSEIAAAIEREADTRPAGDVVGAARLRTGEARRAPDQIEQIAITSRPDGTQLLIGDIARVTQSGPDRLQAFFVGADPAIEIAVVRDATGDTVEIQNTVEEISREYAASLPAGVTVELTGRRGDVISGRLNLLVDNALMGLGLVVILLFLFLNARTAFWVAAGIPVAMLAAVALMYAFGITLNLISLFALIITLGIVVDDAIVVGEHADFRARELGEDPATASENAARRMFLPVFSATITTIIAFMGLVAIGGRFGELIADIPYTVVLVLVASLVECFLILPNHMSHSVGASNGQAWYDWPSRQVNRGFGWVRERLFRPFIAGVIWTRYPVIAAVCVLLSVQVAQVVRGDIQWRFISFPEQSTVTGNFSMLPGTTRADTEAQMRSLQSTIETLGAEYAERHGTNPIVFSIATIGGGSGRGIGGSDTKDPDQLGAISIELIDADSRPYSSFEFVGELQGRITQLPATEAVSFRSFRGGPGGDAIDVQLFGAEPEVLKAAAEALKVALGRFPEISALEDTLSYDREELILTLTPQGEALGFDIAELNRILRNRLRGIEATSFPDGVRSATVQVQLPAEERAADFLTTTQMRTPQGEYVPLGDIVRVESRTGFSQLNRENGLLVVSVTGDLDDEDAQRATDIMMSIEEELLPELRRDFPVDYRLSGLSEQESRFLADARIGTIMVLAGIYLTLCWIFSSWSRPLVVMSIVPFGVIGMIYGHARWDVPLSMFSIIGLIGMIGIIINDSIVLVTTIDEKARDRGMVPAIIDGAADRLRPVLLTTLTTVLGLTPLLYEGSTQAEFLKPTVITLAYGLGFGMVLVLFVVPALLAIGQDLGRQTRAARRGWRAPRAVRLPLWIAAVSAAALFVVAMGPALWGATPLVPGLPMEAPRAFGLFAAALAGVCLLIWAISAAALGLRRGRGTA